MYEVTSIGSGNRDRVNHLRIYSLTSTTTVSKPVFGSEVDDLLYHTTGSTSGMGPAPMNFQHCLHFATISADFLLICMSRFPSPR
jgi:hypothetical protein